MSRNYRLIVGRVVTLLALVIGLSCGGDEPDGTVADAGDDAGGNGDVSDASDASDASEREGYTWRKSSVKVEVRPDDDAAVNGNMEVDPAEVDVTFYAEFALRPDEDSSEDEEIPVEDGTVLVGVGDVGASADEDFEWIELTHQGDGTYTGSDQGLAAVYRMKMEAPGVTSSTNTTESIPFARILSPVDGDSYPRSQDLAIAFEPIEQGIMVEALLDGRMLSRASSVADQEELAISSAWLERGTSPKVGIKRVAGEVSVGSAGASGIVIEMYREVDVTIE
ncbi:hypothetical protein FRC98_18735 [Lujinxingia vulgaris]|uniref:Uncharacterized protein n=1 Tax=Lujinxingia vulgaris TaxID=2600176 RepID=A0A5C6X8C7_9DELT|nr:hypothetical protein [Lujinxingia vulgaris]TXD34233.1 hypothetical protein FRC98_18735 [Lujinxingia vulgaris]